VYNNNGSKKAIPKTYRTNGPVAGVSRLLPETYSSGWVMLIQSSIRAGIQRKFVKVNTGSSCP